MHLRKSPLRLKLLPVVVLISVTLLIAVLPAGIILASSGNLVNPGFETGNFSGWVTGTVTQGVAVVGPELLATGLLTPPEGNYMARLGNAAASPNAQQLPGPNQIYQDFIANSSTLHFVYNIYTWDYTGFNHFGYELTDVASGNVIASYSQGAWGTANTGGMLKTTGWTLVAIDISQYTGRTLRLQLDCGGSPDEILPTWAYIDVSAPIPAPGVSPWGITALAVIFGGAMVWVIGKRQIRHATH
jgi:hypothetical protein